MVNPRLAGNTVLLRAETFEMKTKKKRYFKPFPGKAKIERQSNFENLWAVYSTNSFCKHVLKTVTTLSISWTALLINFYCHYIFVGKIFTYLHLFIIHLHIYLFFILCTKLHVARMQTKFFRSCPHHITGWTGLFLTTILRSSLLQEINHKFTCYPKFVLDCNSFPLT